MSFRRDSFHVFRGGTTLQGDRHVAKASIMTITT
jgi:hypothetical protein